MILTGLNFHKYRFSYGNDTKTDFSFRFRFLLWFYFINNTFCTKFFPTCEFFLAKADTLECVITILGEL